MSSEERSGEKYAARLRALRESLAGVKLRPPFLPRVPAELPGKAARRYPVLQELAAARQDIQDEFSKGQLELSEINSRIEEDIAAVRKGAPVLQPVPAHAAAEPRQVPAARAPAAPRAPEKSAPAGPALPAAGRRPGTAWLIAAAAVCAAAFGLYKFYSGFPEFSVPLPSTRSAGLCLDREGRRVFFVDPQRQLLVTISVPEKRVKFMQSFPAEALKGLAFDGTSFWSSDGNAIRRHGLEGGYAALGTYKPGQKISFLSWDGDHLWAASTGGELTRYSAGGSMKPEEVFVMPEGRTAGISITGGKLWLLDPVSAKISAYKLGLKLVLLAEADISSLLPPGRPISGFSVSGDYLWVITENPSELVRIELKRIKTS